MVDVELMTLTTVMIMNKYLSIIDANFTYPGEWQAFRYNICDAFYTLSEHKSQMYSGMRTLKFLFCRYTCVNSFARWLQRDKQNAAVHKEDRDNKLIGDEDGASTASSTKTKKKVAID